MIRKRIDGVIADLSPLREQLLARGYANGNPAVFDVFNATHMEAESEASANEVLVYGEIVSDEMRVVDKMWGFPSVSGSEFRRALSQVEGDRAVIRINSPGGLVTEAAVMRHALQERQASGKSDVAVIDGSAASAASLLAFTSQRVEMADLGLIYIHEPMVGLGGYFYAADLLELASDLEAFAPRLAAVYEERGIDYAKLGFKSAIDLMRGKRGNGTELDAQKALDSGMIDAIGPAGKESTQSESASAMTSDTMKNANRKTAASAAMRHRMSEWLAKQEKESSS